MSKLRILKKYLEKCSLNHNLCNLIIKELEDRYIDYLDSIIYLDRVNNTYETITLMCLLREFTKDYNSDIKNISYFGDIEEMNEIKAHFFPDIKNPDDPEFRLYEELNKNLNYKLTEYIDVVYNKLLKLKLNKIRIKSKKKIKFIYIDMDDETMMQEIPECSFKKCTFFELERIFDFLERKMYIKKYDTEKDKLFGVPFFMYDIVYFNIIETAKEISIYYKLEIFD